MQSKKYSLIESVSNVIIGYCVALLSQIIIFPFFGIYVSLEKNIYIGLWFTIISIARSYMMRRFFNKIGGHNKKNDLSKLQNETG